MEQPHTLSHTRKEHQSASVPTIQSHDDVLFQRALRSRLHRKAQRTRAPDPEVKRLGESGSGDDRLTYSAYTPELMLGSALLASLL